MENQAIMEFRVTLVLRLAIPALLTPSPPEASTLMEEEGVHSLLLWQQQRQQQRLQLATLA